MSLEVELFLDLLSLLTRHFGIGLVIGFLVFVILKPKSHHP